ncbi:MAG: 3-beta hydroxysteroid dehydrogenase [Nitrospirales bacterium]|nr:MAG: 3-beta hydroxysteroid dehydrogenase [Nitrospirales bacterium]
MSLPMKYKNLDGQKILVTGAAGFIGGALFHRLASYGLDVTGTVLHPSEAEELRAAGHKAEILDLSSDERWDDLLRGKDQVFHIAAMFQEVNHNEKMYDKVNNAGSFKLAQTASRVGVKRFVHCSTVGVHGHVKEIPATEKTPFNPMDEYHRTKLAGELAILEFAKHLPDDGMIVPVNRPSMVYGPGDMRLLKLFKMILTEKFRMIGSGDVLAHFGYIEDQVDSLLLCAVAPRDQVHCEAFNIASSQPITLNELTAIIAAIGGVKLRSPKIPVSLVWGAGLCCELMCKPFGLRPPIFRRRVGFFTHNRAFDYSKAKTHLNYEPKWDEARGIKATIEWYRKQGLVP